MALTSQAQYTIPNPHNANVSVQVGDLIYRNCVGTSDIGSGHIQSSRYLIGTVTQIREDIETVTTTLPDGTTSTVDNPILEIKFNYSSIVGSTTPSVLLNQIPGSSSFTGNCSRFFLSFKKNDNANISSLAGYFASTTFVNNDIEIYAELFADSSEATFSSK